MRNILLLTLAIILTPYIAWAAQTSTAKNPLDAYAPFEDVIQITASDSTTYSPPLRGCFVEVAGDLAIQPVKSAASVTISVLKGQLLPVIMTKVLSTGTTATVSCGR